MNFESKNLNQTCPFGDRSTKHSSIAGEAPNIRESNIANKEISRILSNFVQDLQRTSRDWKPVSIDEYNQFSKLANVEHPHVPSDIAEVVPVPESRGADSILHELSEYDNSLVKGLLHLHEVAINQFQSDLVASREVMRIISKNFDNIFSSTEHTVESVFDELANNMKNDSPNRLQETLIDVDSSLGFPVSVEIRDSLVLYQSLQERFESNEQIESVNDFFNHRPDVVEAILGIQNDLCQKINLFIEKNPGMENSTVAFSEVAFVSENDNSVSPSPRFLKIITHNWGSYFIDKPDAPVEQLLSTAITRALEDEIYRQYIFVFRSGNESLKLHGIAPKVCPARTSIGHMIKHYIED
jgi:hypothetical protein